MFRKRTLQARQQREQPTRRSSAKLPTADALRNTGGPPNRPPTDPQRPQQIGPNGPGQQRPSGAGWISRIVLLLLLLVVAYNVVLLWQPGASSQTITYKYSDFVAAVDNYQVQSVTITDQRDVTGTLKQAETYNGVKATSFKTTYPFTDDTLLQQDLAAHGVTYDGKTS
ncbi:MAG TPA: ATP-dependent metallopeptidase FtsH/Yme1/Tma family protein, partial [Ktedonobacterales bacterium]|nr:ATP-dependent metallopeptidase FtsH/Yme1/Tma family protein [Ktedonobacterales bacterium]